MAKLWRDSASLIILVRNRNNLFQNGHNFKVLIFARTEKTSFMPKSCVFPGGAVDLPDQSKEWLKHFQNFGVTDYRFKQLTNVEGKRPPIFQKNNSEIAKEISLRITAIRETFEEIGVLICRKKDEISKASLYGDYFEDFDRHKWQEIVHNDPKRFLELCQTLNIIPDLWSLYEWSDWLTPTPFSRRYETAFFIVGLNSLPNIIPEKHEVAKLNTPKEYFQQQRNQEIWLAPPQCYELSRMQNVSSLDVLIQYSKDRNLKGLPLLLPIFYTCTDGLAGTLPGDDYYLNNSTSSEMIETNQTLEEFRKKAKNLHRSEIKGSHNYEVFVNIKLDYGCLNPNPEFSKL